MKTKKGKINLLVFLTIIVGVFVTISVTLYVSAQTSRLAQDNFNNQVEDIQDGIGDALNLYKTVLVGGKGLYASSEFVSKEEWKSYIDNLDLEENYPGVLAVGYAEYVRGADITEFTSIIQAEGSYSDFMVYPEGSREEYVVVRHLEPQNPRNDVVIGFDIFSEERRRDALFKARDNNTFATTAKITLVQETNHDNQAGIVVDIPVFKDEPAEDSQDATPKLQGYVFGAFRMDDFIEEALKDELDTVGMQIFDDIDAPYDASHLLYSNDVESVSDGQSKVVSLDVGQRNWALQFSAPNNYQINNAELIRPWFVAIVGLLVTSSLFVMVRSISTRQTRAMQLAKAMREDLKLEQDFWKNITKKLDGYLVIYNTENKVVELSDEFENNILLDDTGSIIGDNILFVLRRIDKQATNIMTESVNDHDSKTFESKFEKGADVSGLIIHHASGRFYECEFSQIKRNSKQAGGYWFFRDVTEYQSRQEDIIQKDEYLESVNKSFIGRELRIKQLKEEVANLKQQKAIKAKKFKKPNK